MFSNKPIKSGSDYKRLLQETTRQFNKAAKHKSQLIDELDKNNRAMQIRLEKYEETLNAIKKENKNLAIVAVCFTVVAIANIVLLIIIK